MLKNIPIRVATSAERYCGGEQKWWSQPVSRPPCTPNQQAIANFDETKESAVECAKQNVDAASLTEREKEVAKESVELFANDVARKFKVAMKQSGKIV